jgi:hypothetical protein
LKIEFVIRLCDGWLVVASVMNLKVKLDLSICRDEEVDNSVAQNIMQQTKVSENRISLYFHQTSQGHGFSAHLLHLTNFQLSTLQHDLLYLRRNQLGKLVQHITSFVLQPLYNSACSLHQSQSHMFDFFMQLANQHQLI